MAMTEQYVVLILSVVLLRIGCRWVTSKPDVVIQESFVHISLRKYTAQRLGIPIAVTEELDYDAIGAVKSVHK